ncbi:MAG: NAD(P)/FAD-dependent oxidoreductase [Calothrix sp. MO_167.B42]|nr:NAD(P)/FAD-dependent oxidoreductase [Calothrix sp. MO_167.B42]
MLDRKHYDVAILGGGPGGTSAAITLAQAGVSVVVCERSHYQENRVGEMLSPGICPLLVELGQWERFIQAGHLASPGIICCWGSSQPYENEFIFNPYGSGWHIDRCNFDRSLALAAKEAGAIVCLNTLVVGVNYEAGGWNISMRRGGELTNLRADFLIHASGRSQFSPVSPAIFATQKMYVDSLVGVAQFFHHIPNPAIDDRRTLIEATAQGWWYSAQLPRGKAIAVLMTDRDLLPVKRRDLQAYWQKNLLTTVYTKERVNTWYPVKQLHIYDACTARQDYFSGQQWLAVGDAAATYDPLSAQGIMKAISNGISAARAIIESGMSHVCSFPDYHGSLTTSFAEYMKERQLYYAQERRWENNFFWQRRQANIMHPYPKSANYFIQLH